MANMSNVNTIFAATDKTVSTSEVTAIHTNCLYNASETSSFIIVRSSISNGMIDISAKPTIQLAIGNSMRKSLEAYSKALQLVGA